MMECYSEQSIAMAVDGELPAEEARRLREHLATCRRCRELVDALRAENLVLSESLHELPEEAVSPSFSHMPGSWTWSDFAVVAAVLALGSIVVPWIDGLSIPDALQWLNPFTLSGRTNLFFNLSYYFARGGTAMFTDYAAVIGGSFLVLLIGGSLLLLGRRGRPQTGVRLLVGLLALSLHGSALERRHSEFVTVGANETVDDTLLAIGDIVHVDGVINGDLLAFGGTVEVRGTVKGDLITFASRTLVSGTVEGSIFDFSKTFDLDGQLSHSVYGFAQSLNVNSRARVGEGVVAGAGDASIDGEVTRGVTLYAGNADVSGRIGRELSMAGDSLTVTSTARIGGNLKACVKNLKNVHIAEGATIAGTRDIQMRVKKNRFTQPRFYFYRAIWLAAAMAAGWLGLVLFPSFFLGTPQAVRSGWRSLGLGIAVLAGVPVAIIVMAITLVGLPLALILLATYLVSIYLSQIWVGALLGQMLLKPGGTEKRDWLLGLLVGLVILTVIRYIPFVGGLIHFGVVCLGLGAFAWQLYRTSRPAMTA